MLEVYLLGLPESLDCRCSHCGNEHKRVSRHCLYEANVAEELSKMATEAGLYHAIWSPRESGRTKTRELILHLENGLKLLTSDRSRFQAFAPKSNSNAYAELVAFVKRYLAKCQENPDADVLISRT